MSLIVTDEHSWGVCDWGCGREADLIEVAVDGRAFTRFVESVSRSCETDLRRRRHESEERCLGDDLDMAGVELGAGKMALRSLVGEEPYDF